MVMMASMIKSAITSFIGQGRPEIRIWHAATGNSPPHEPYSFTWKEGCLMGIYDVSEESGEPLDELQSLPHHE